MCIIEDAEKYKDSKELRDILIDESKLLLEEIEIISQDTNDNEFQTLKEDFKKTLQTLETEKAKSRPLPPLPERKVTHQSSEEPIYVSLSLLKLKKAKKINEDLTGRVTQTPQVDPKLQERLKILDKIIAELRNLDIQQ